MMRHSLLLVVTMFVFILSASSKDKPELAADKIPSTLLKDANAVLRQSVTQIEISSATDITVTETYAITVLNEKGSVQAILNEYYNSLFSIESLEGILYDKNGVQVNKMKKRAVKDNIGDQTAFFDDQRRKEYKFTYADYPYTCEFKIVRQYTTAFNLPPWHPQEYHDCSIEHASVEVSCPEKMRLTYKEYHTDKHPVLTHEDGLQKLRMELINEPTYKIYDELTVNENYLSSALDIVLPDVQLDEFKGDLSSWNSFGAFVHNINAGRDILPEATAKMIHSLTDTCHTPYSKIDLLYRFIQKSTRYVNISLGIGGWQTHEATEVAEKGYGDCKALSNYMKALLKEAGVTAYQVLVFSGTGRIVKMDSSFPSRVFNHMILCVPVDKDTVWMDCTSKSCPTGYLSSFTANRQALMLTPAGGFVVRTPAYDQNSSSLHRSAILTAKENGELTATINATYKGYWWDQEQQVMNSPREKNTTYFNSKFLLPTYSTNSFNISSSESDHIPSINEHITLTGSGMIIKSGNRLFITPIVFTTSIKTVTNDEQRTTPFELNNDYSIHDTTILFLSGTYILEKAPADINIEMPFGSYHATTYFEKGNTIRVIVTYKHKSGVFPASIFPDYKKLSKIINQHMAYDKIVLYKAN